MSDSNEKRTRTYIRGISITWGGGVVQELALSPHSEKVVFCNGMKLAYYGEFYLPKYKDGMFLSFSPRTYYNILDLL